jgi:hypothetical protein
MIHQPEKQRENTRPRGWLGVNAMRTMRRAFIVVSVLSGLGTLLTSCGGGSSGGMQMQSPPSNLQYAAPPPFTIKRAIAPLKPTVVGSVTSYSVSPALPAALSLDSSSGVISGTPTSVTAKMNYTVTAANSDGSTTTMVSLVVNDLPPVAAYASPYYAFTANIATQAISPTVSGGAVVSWSVTPSLPAGLALSTVDGSISGTPTAEVAASSYVVTATNSGGQSVNQLTLAVAAAPLLDLGHAAEVVLVRTNSSEVMSLDYDGHWLLQDYRSGATLASGDGACVLTCNSQNGRFVNNRRPPVDIAGNTVIDPGPGGLEIRSAVDGSLRAAVPLPSGSWYQLAADGSYVTTGSSNGLTVWSLAGTGLASRAGDYSSAWTFSAPLKVLIAMGPAGPNVIETVSVPGGGSSVSPSFQGQFQSWFGDGARFITSLGSTVWIYSNGAVQEDLKNPVSAPLGFGGLGNWFWTYGPVTIYQVGASGSPVLTTTGGDEEIPSGSTIGLVSGTQISVVDLSGALPVSASYTSPIPQLTGYGANSAAVWLTGNQYGLVLDGASIATQPRYLTLGSVWSIAGGANYFSVAMASGAIRYFSANTDSPAGTIPFLSSQLITSADGTILAAAANTYYGTDRTVNVYSLPGGTLLSNWPSTTSSSPTQSLADLSADGKTLAFIYSSGCLGLAIAATGVSPPSWCDTVTSPNVVRLSPDGTLVAASTQPMPVAAVTDIYKNGTLVTTVPGWAVGWLDNGRLLDNQYTDNRVFTYQGAQIVDPSGQLLATPPIPGMMALEVVTPDTIYYAGMPNSGPLAQAPANTIVSLTTGASVWASGDTARGIGAVSGSQVIFASGSLVLAQPH